nr:hypothetical protein CFP56_19659 [Quercus suber]
MKDDRTGCICHEVVVGTAYLLYAAFCEWSGGLGCLSATRLPADDAFTTAEDDFGLHEATEFQSSNDYSMRSAGTLNQH